jgi:hypothetical protein
LTRAQAILNRLLDERENREINQILQQLFSSDTQVFGSESVKSMAHRLMEQFQSASTTRQQLQNAIQERIEEMERQTPTSNYSLEQFACLRRHFNQFYERHKGKLQEPVEIELVGDTVYITYRDGAKREVGKRYTATSMRDLVNKMAWMIAEAMSDTLRKEANVMKFLSPLYQEESERADNRPYLERKVEYLMQIAKPFWSASQPPGDVRFEEFLAVSVPLSPDDFRHESDARALENAVNRLTEQAGVASERVKDGYPFALTILNRTYGARAYYLKSTALMEHTYLKRSRNPQVRAHLHLDVRFAQLPLLTPVYPQAQQWWALALALGYVAVIGDSYYFGMEDGDPDYPPRPKYITQRAERLVFNDEMYDGYLRGAYQTGEPTALIGNSYTAAFREFTRDARKLAQIQSAFCRLLEKINPEDFREARRRYLETLLERANNHNDEPNPWREEREALIRFQPFGE